MMVIKMIMRGEGGREHLINGEKKLIFESFLFLGKIKMY